MYESFLFYILLPLRMCNIHVWGVCVPSQAQMDAGECHIKIPIITFDSPEGPEGGARVSGSEDEGKQRQILSQSEESTILEGPDPQQENPEQHATADRTASPQLTNENSSSGIDVHSHPDDTEPLDPNVDCQGFLRLPHSVGRCGPGGRIHARGLSMDSGKDAVLLSDRSHHAVSPTPVLNRLLWNSIIEFF